MKRLFLVFLMACGAASLLADDTEIDEIRARINGLAAEGHYREALPWTGRLLDVRRLSFGESHPDVARTFITYAQIYERLNQPQDALRWHEAALAMLEKVAPDTPELAFCLTQFGWYLKDHDQGPRAESLLARAVAIDKKLGADADTAAALDRVSVAQEKTKQYDAAIATRIEALKLFEKTSGPNSDNTLVTVLGIGELHARARHTAEATTYLERYAEGMARRHGPDGEQTRKGLLAAGDFFFNTAKNYELAARAYSKNLEACQRALGDENEETLHARGALAFLYRKSERFADAEKLYQDIVDLRTRTLGPEQASTLQSLLEMAGFYKDWQRLSKAVEIQRAVLEIRKRVLGPAHHDTLALMGDLANSLGDLREFDQAEALQRERLKLTQAAHANDENASIKVSTALASLAAKQERWGEAETLYRQILAAKERLFGKISAQSAFTYIDLGSCLKRQQKFPEARDCYQKAYEIRKTVLGPLHETTIANIDDLATLAENMSEYPRAISIYKSELEALTQAFGENHPKIVDCLNSLGGDYYLTSQFQEAKAAFSRSLAMSETVSGPNHTQTAACAFWLGLAQMATGDFSTTESNFQRALRIYQSAFGVESEKAALALTGLCDLYLSIGDGERANSRALEALKILETKDGPDGQSVAIPLAVIGITELQRGDINAALERLERAHRLLEKYFGGQHPFMALTLRSLGICYYRLGRASDAERALREAMALTDASLGTGNWESAVNRLFLSFVLGDQGDLKQALALASEARAAIENKLGRDNNYAALVDRLLASLQLKEGDMEGARKSAVDSAACEERILKNILSFGTEGQRLAFQQQFGAFDILASVQDTPALALAVLRRKGLVLDSLLEDRRVAREAYDNGARELLDQLRAAKERLFQFTTKIPNGAPPQVMEQRNAEVAKLEAEADGLENALARKVSAAGASRRALQTTVADVQSALGGGTALIEFVCFNDSTNGNTGRAYGAMVITPSGEPRWLRLGSATDIEEDVRLFQLSARGKTDPFTLAQTLTSLYQRVWAPIAAVLPPGITSVVFSPDGELNFVSFATLLDPDGHFLAEHCAIRYVASGRDLLAKVPPSPEKTLAIFAAPKFDLNAAAAAQDAVSGGAPDAAPDVAPDMAPDMAPGLAAADTRDFRGQKLTPLPGAAREAGALAKVAAGHGWPAESFVGELATEAQLSRLKAPRILHLATHGFFLAELPRISTAEGFLASVTAAQVKPQSVQNPMHRSGLALAGAQNTLDAWASGKAPPPATDGIVTAEEVGSLNLDGTWLVTLSACDTGSGEARGGEGVLGLRRGFVQAGAQNLLLTLWPVDDETTVQIMLDFYDRALKTSNAPQALADTQRDWLVKLRKEMGLVEAVTLAGPFIMSSQGKP